jgi:nitroreductase
VEALELLLGRRSSVRLREPGPSEEELDTIFKSALTAPDHGKLRPWFFIVIREEQRQAFGNLMADMLKVRRPDSGLEALNRERQKALRAPVIIVTVARIKCDSRIPEVEQIMSAAAAAQNIMLAAHALGYGAMWRTGAGVYDANVKSALGLELTDIITGLIYIGTRDSEPPKTVRPIPNDFVATWNE